MVCEFKMDVDICVTEFMLFRLSYTYYVFFFFYLLIDHNLKWYNQSFLCTSIRIDSAKSVQMLKISIKFGTSTGTAMPFLMKQIAMY